MSNILSKHRNLIIFFVLLLSGLLVRTYFVDKKVVGDLMNYAEWGERLATTGPKDFYFSEGWYYSVPVYPPVSMWTFAGAYWLNEHRYVLAQLHNLIKFPPSMFIVYFYKWGYIFLLKLIPIVFDLALSFLIYKLIKSLTGSTKKSLFGAIFYLFNPITIFLSGYWGQTDSLVAFFGIVSFVLLANKKPAISMPLMFLGLYFKPSWAIFAPFYVFMLYKTKPKLSSVLSGILLTIVLFVITTAPFASGSVLEYGWKLFRERYPLPIGIDGKASISAFNFQTIFFKLDIDYSHEKILGLTSGKLGLIFYTAINIFVFATFKTKHMLRSTLIGIYAIGIGSFLFMATMLERYFFPALVPMIVLAFVNIRVLPIVIVANLIFFVNIIYSFYRRGSDEIYHFFIDNNFFVIKLLSITQVAGYLLTLKMLQFDSADRYGGTPRTNRRNNSGKR